MVGRSEWVGEEAQGWALGVATLAHRLDMFYCCMCELLEIMQMFYFVSTPEEYSLRKIGFRSSTVNQTRRGVLWYPLLTAPEAPQNITNIFVEFLLKLSNLGKRMFTLLFE